MLPDPTAARAASSSWGTPANSLVEAFGEAEAPEHSPASDERRDLRDQVPAWGERSRAAAASRGEAPSDDAGIRADISQGTSGRLSKPFAVVDCGQ